MSNIVRIVLYLATLQVLSRWLQVEGKRFQHSLTIMLLLLLEAALYDPEVINKQFVTVSESGLPLYHGGVLYWQLLAERRSRAGPSRDYKDLMSVDKVRISVCAERTSMHRTLLSSALWHTLHAYRSVACSRAVMLSLAS